MLLRKRNKNVYFSFINENIRLLKCQYYKSSNESQHKNNLLLRGWISREKCKALPSPSCTWVRLNKTYDAIFDYYCVYVSSHFRGRCRLRPASFMPRFTLWLTQNSVSRNAFSPHSMHNPDRMLRIWYFRCLDRSRCVR